MNESAVERTVFPREQWIRFGVVGLLVPAILYAAYRNNPVLSHDITEMFSVIVACGIFMLTWNARELIDNHYFVFLGIAYLFVGAIDYLHTLSFAGTISRESHGVSIELWFAARYLQSFALVAAPVFAYRKTRPGIVLAGFATAAVLLVAAVHQGVLQDFYVPDKGLTSAKALSDHIVSAIQLLSIGTLWLAREKFDRKVLRLLVLSVLFSIAAEMSADLYRDAYIYNSVIGHYLKVVSFYLVYLAVVTTGLIRPYGLLFRNLKRSEEELRAARDGLETRVSERTAELRAVNERLEKELAERQRAVEMRELILDLHHLTHSKESVRDFLSSVSVFLQERFGFKAIGIRYRRGADYPYFEARGFPQEFVEAEMSLCAGDRGAASGGGNGENPPYECACGAVIAGKGDPCRAFFTPYGTFWTNGASDLVAGNEAARALVTRGRCVRQGYESIALVPLRLGDVAFGLLQFNDRRKGVFHPHLLSQLERVAENIGAALSRLLALEALQESEDRFRSLVENSMVGILIVADGRIVFHNPRQERITGKIPDGIPFRELGQVHPDDAGEFERLCAAAAHPGPERLEVDVRLLVPEGGGGRGSVRWLHCQANPVVFRGVASLLVDTVDITRVKELEQAVTAREKLASIGQLAAGIAHEIRNPLSGININISTLELLCRRAEGLEPDEREKIETVVAQAKAASEKISSVIRRVMEFSKPAPPRMDRVDINRVVREALSISEMTRRKGKVEFREALSPEPLPCHGDPALLEQVVLNLITNAMQAMESMDGKGTITVGAERVGDKAVIRVADTGPGVPEHLRERIFEPFYTTRREGHGIGLSFSNRIVSDHGGRLSVRPAEGGGAEFRIELPLKEERSPT
ncbi:MAG: PAS domain S-box protein [Deltaproteobacteria bacterium]|nr:PAS domain S-box protein [Deltaproteobacteria bacterium]